MMKMNLLWVVLLGFTLAACGPRTQPATDLTEPAAGLLELEAHEAFFNNLSGLCGQSFYGREEYRSPHGASWAERTMIMYVTECEDTHVYIPFHVDEDHSRTWMFIVEDGKLRFRHQHLHEDGTQEDGSMYGGYANDMGNAFVQYFPADEYTAGVIAEGGGNIWTVSLDENMTYFSYRLERDGEKRFEIVFDLTNPVVN